MSGWNLKSGIIIEQNIDDNKFWNLFKFVFSPSSMKKSTYKFGLIKALLDNLLYGEETPSGMFFTYEKLFSKFTENYWNLVVKYDLKQMIPDSFNRLSKIEMILKSYIETNKLSCFTEFANLSETEKKIISNKVAKECRKHVIGALYNDFQGNLYSFDLKADGLILSYNAFIFMLKYKNEIESLNYDAWAKLLSKINKDNPAVKFLNEQDFVVSKQIDHNLYRDLLYKEYEENNCFYCGRKLLNSILVDYFIPWNFLKDDKLWNFVLACPECNEKKNNLIPNTVFLEKILYRNNIIQNIPNRIIQTDFINYSDDMFTRICDYAKLTGIKEYVF